LFGEFENFYGEKVEKDTEYEKQVFQLVQQFVDADYPPDSPKKEFEKVFKELLQCKNKYDAVLAPDNLNKVYRGLNTKVSVLAQNDFEIKSENDDYIILKDENFLYKPYTNVQSWTTSSTIPEEFVSNLFYENGDYYAPTILTIKDPVQDEFLFDPDFLNTMDFEEHEVVRIGGAIECFCEALLYKPNIEQYKNNKDFKLMMDQINPEILSKFD
jgi:hypothetical protein